MSITMRQSGPPEFFNTEKALGFIVPDAGSSNAFMRVSAVEGSGLAMAGGGANLSFETDPDRGGGTGLKAIDLQVDH